MLQGFAILLFFQWLGVWLGQRMGWPFPAQVIGMLLLFIFLFARSELSDSLQTAAAFLLQSLALLFVPAATGIFAHWGGLVTDGMALILAVVVSTLLGMAVTAWVAQKVALYLGLVDLGRDPPSV